MSGKHFPRTARLLNKAAFDAVFRAGQSAGSNFFRALVTPADGAHARLGITVPKRVLKHAHDRNLIKRLLREHFRLQRSELPPIHLVLLARGAIAKATRQELHSDIERILRRAAALKPQDNTGRMVDSPGSKDGVQP